MADTDAEHGGDLVDSEQWCERHQLTPLLSPVAFPNSRTHIGICPYEVPDATPYCQSHLKDVRTMATAYTCRASRRAPTEREQAAGPDAGRQIQHDERTPRRLGREPFGVPSSARCGHEFLPELRTR